MNARKAVLWAIAILILAPALCQANYHIIMRSGSRMLVDTYWEQDGKVCFYYNGDLVEMPSAVVKQIVETDEALPVPELAAIAAPPPPPPVTGKVLRPQETGAVGAPGVSGAAGTPGVPGAPGAAPGKEEEPCVPAARDTEMDGEFTVLSKRYENRFEMERDELISLNRELFTWRDMVLKRKLGALYRDEVEKIYIMCDELENLVRQ